MRGIPSPYSGIDRSTKPKRKIHPQTTPLHRRSIMCPKRCPFYGFRWPDRQSRLVHIGGAECGLDIDRNGPCKMESTGREVDFRSCEIASAARVYLDCGADRIRFYPPGAPEGIALDAWTDRVMGWP